MRTPAHKLQMLGVVPCVFLAGAFPWVRKWCRAALATAVQNAGANIFRFHREVFFLVSGTISSLILSHHKTYESQVQDHRLENFNRMRNYFCDFVRNQFLHDFEL
jgi:hypothetical protein